MSHYAVEINADNIVTRIIVCDSVAWAEENLGGVWLPSETKIASGSTYDEERDAFIPPRPFESWVLDESTCLWTAPLPYPDDGADYTWNEELFVWELIAE